MSHLITAACTGCTACVRVCPVNAISGKRKAVHQIDPNICIDCGACGRTCPSEAVFDPAGELCVMIKRNAWLHPVIQETKCIACGMCVQVCPTSALDFTDHVDHRNFTIAYLKEEKNCIGCSFCEGSCPVNAIHMQAAPA